VLLSLLATSCGGSNETNRTVSKTDPASEKPVPQMSTSGQTGANPNRITWHDYDEGMRILVGSAKYGIIYFDTTDCGPCMWLEDSLYSDPRIIEAMNKDFIAIKVQSARADTVHYQGRAFTESYLRKLFYLAGYPTTFFVEGRRNKYIFAQPSIIYPDRMLDYMGYLTSKAYLSTDLEDYLENKGVD
jgi:thioredoxin-related protein